MAGELSLVLLLFMHPMCAMQQLLEQMPHDVRHVRSRMVVPLLISLEVVGPLKWKLVPALDDGIADC